MMSKEMTRDARMPIVYSYNDELFADGLKRKLKSLQFIIDALDMPTQVVDSSIDRARGEINWHNFESAARSEDSLLAVQWMKSIWTEKFHIVSNTIFGVWPSRFALRRAILFAIVTDAHLMCLVESGNRANYRDELSGEAV